MEFNKEIQDTSSNINYVESKKNKKNQQKKI